MRQPKDFPQGRDAHVRYAQTAVAVIVLVVAAVVLIVLFLDAASVTP